VLEENFCLGAQVIEKSIVKALCRRLEIEYVEVKNHTFTRYLNDIKSAVEVKD
jgi:hypothetical protein